MYRCTTNLCAYVQSECLCVWLGNSDSVVCSLLGYLLNLVRVSLCLAR